MATRVSGVAGVCAMVHKVAAIRVKGRKVHKSFTALGASLPRVGEGAPPAAETRVTRGI